MSEESWLAEILEKILANTNQILLTQQAQGKLLETLRADQQIQDQTLAKILSYVEPPPAVGFIATASPILTGENKMDSKPKATKAKISADVAVVDNGNGVLITVNAVDADNQPTAWPSGAAAPSASEVDPSGSTGPYFGAPGTPTATSTGYTIAVPLLQPPPGLVTGVQFNVTVASGFPNQTSPITEPLESAVDVVAGPAGGFVASASAD